MIEIVDIEQRPDLFEQAVEVFWKQWGSQSNYKFYHDCMLNSCRTESNLPSFYIALLNNTIIGTYALLRNDLNSRQDLFPWLACLFIQREHRGNKYGSMLLDHAAKEAATKGYQNLYLCTDMVGYYEKYNWSYLTDGYIFTGDPTRIYTRSRILDESLIIFNA